MKQLIFLILAAFAGSLGAATETVYGSASLAQPADQAGIGARALAMGGAFVGVAEGSPALLWNSAGLGKLKAMDLSLHHNSGLDDSVQETLIVASPLSSLGAFGAAFNYIDNGAVEGRDASGNLTSSFNSGSMGFQVGWGREVISGISLGLAAKSTSQSLGSTVYSSFAADIGGMWEAAPGLKVGLNYANLGSQVGGSTKANGLRLGASLAVPVSSNQVLIAAGTQVEPGGVSRVQLGAEGSFSGAFAVRAGYQLNLADQGFEGLAGMTLGAGVKFASASLDYAYLPFGELGASQRISLSYIFNESAPKAEVAQKSAAERANSFMKKPAKEGSNSKISSKKKPTNKD